MSIDVVDANNELMSITIHDITNSTAVKRRLASICQDMEPADVCMAEMQSQVQLRVEKFYFGEVIEDWPDFPFIRPVAVKSQH